MATFAPVTQEKAHDCHLIHVKHGHHIIKLPAGWVIVLLLSGCWGWVEYFDVTADEIKLPKGITDVIPQEGTALAIDLTYEYVPKTKFEPGEDWKQYRFRALVDGREYCYGVISGEIEAARIPIMANDTIIGSVRPEDLKAFKALYPGYHNQEQATMTLSLVAPGK